MDKIPSFSKNHDELKRGLHLCGATHGVTTWDLRFKTPNGGDYIDIAAMHRSAQLRSQGRHYLFRAYGLPHGLLSFDG